MIVNEVHKMTERREKPDKDLALLSLLPPPALVFEDVEPWFAEEVRDGLGSALASAASSQTTATPGEGISNEQPLSHLTCWSGAYPESTALASPTPSNVLPAQEMFRVSRIPPPAVSVRTSSVCSPPSEGTLNVAASLPISA